MVSSTKNKERRGRATCRVKQIVLPSLHIKRGLMKNFVKAMERDGPAFRYLSEKFHTLSEAKIEESIFIGPQIRELLKDIQFDSIITGNEKAAWEAFQQVATSFSETKELTTKRTLLKIFYQLMRPWDVACRWKSIFSILIWTSFLKIVVQ